MGIKTLDTAVYVRAKEAHGDRVLVAVGYCVGISEGDLKTVAQSSQQNIKLEGITGSDGGYW